MKRRKFIKSGITGALGMGLLTGFYTWQIEPFWLEFVHMKMPIQNLPDDFVGKSLMHISDIHIGNGFDYNYIIESFGKAKLFNPDFVVYTGDFVSYEDERQFQQLEEVLKHTVRGKLGTIGILGNHDYGHNWAEQSVATQIESQLQLAGIDLLNNQQIEKSGLNFIGFDDFWGLNFGPQKVMNTLDHSKANIVLSHNPDVCDINIWNGYKGWILFGHTHGGQCKPPFLPPPVLPVVNRSYTSGLFDLHDGRTLYINRALGHFLQVRFNVRPEITVFELGQV